ncbi:MAG: TatD family hydrolase [Lachnospiraceae bacterium]|nr:TatD family hydrolase [Lachnospiraceae bacterium]
MLFDTHAHYDDPQFDPDRDEVIRSLPDHRVMLALVPGCELRTSHEAVRLAETYPHLYAAVGCHPQDAHTFRDEDLIEYRKLAKSPKVVAIGEIGLDYYWAENPPREVQKEVFRKQMRLAEELALPVIIHDRDAHQDCLEIVKEFPAVKGVFHCFSGSVEFSRIILKLGWYLGFDGPITFKNARRNVEAAKEAPLDRLLIETDSPYMAPEPFRGQRNDSRKVYRVAEKLAEIKNITIEEAEAATFENGKRLFRIP